ncbi:MAG TPA: tRNA (adenosine(37)-N6)-threonylcarbamoyltransferase complex dimerization subunit type 1 TsaB [Rectinemataceae bacterium]|nr:tRNA (adenosine(37)-N6)-threonylcarbamoyltransferase complex dimerization subunit type 1 TsaB [Rectinemataceae bacterium]
MNVLAIDSSTALLSVCLATGKGRTEALLDVGLTHAESIIDLVDFCVTRARLTKADIDLVACTEGPGSFTGLRIGMATAKGIAGGLGKPWVAVPTLDCLAWGLENFSGAVVPVIDARKGRLYSAIYLRGERQGGWLDISLEDLAALLDRYPETLVTGPDAVMLEALATERSGIRLDPRAGNGAARALSVLAARRFSAQGGFSDSAGPLYLRPSEAEEASANKDGGDKKA